MFKVYHCSDKYFRFLKAGSYVTPQRDIAISFGLEKPSKFYYLYNFEVSTREFQKTVTTDGRSFINASLPMQGQVEFAYNELGDWENYVTCVPLFCEYCEVFQISNTILNK